MIYHKDIFQAFDDGDFQILAHQVNCQGVMAAGIAKEIKQRYPEHYKHYREEYQHLFPFGAFVVPAQVGENQFVSGIYGQNFYGMAVRQTNYAAFTSGLWGLLEWAVMNDLDQVGLPYGIGCGLAGGDWNVVSLLIDECRQAFEVDINIYKKGEK